MNVISNLSFSYLESAASIVSALKASCLVDDPLQVIDERGGLGSDVRKFGRNLKIQFC